MSDSYALSIFLRPFVLRRRIDYVLKPVVLMLMVFGISLTVEELIGQGPKMDLFEHLFGAALVAIPFMIVGLYLINRLDRLSREMALLATVDSLTGLANRGAFMQRAMKTHAKVGDGVIVLMDADHFKAINDRFGHAAGDDVLRAVADRLREQLRPDDLVGRIGGEEFAAYLPATTLGDAVALAAPLTAVLDVDDSVRVTLSLGFAKAEQSADFMVCLQRADHALYAAKSTGRARFVVWSSDLDDPFATVS